ncbi:Protein N-acetyltransferase, RimJ/RimL family [Chitinophaga rupis]|uniref:Protein N-acetyltransferase, RimJ/RimL family n=1 Tax=Chitinophaga rupis TaxID=573321 RepID=A0A1H8DTM2_9BACT|nr:GNAT family N-acetyltransferase [Chitinophaga rupis]SEN10609.1 Protein N-acetyltransferase, RimJ/RimL family [Chitinophaga rupis]
MQVPITTNRLSIGELSINDHDFVFELLNSKGWLEFIGNRNIHSKEDAVNYISKILVTPNLSYWVVRLIDGNIPVGIISLIKRDYLLYYDLGFAFLPQYMGLGYAYEAAAEVKLNILQDPAHAQLLATTFPHNTSSIRLLKKLGFQFEKLIEIKNEILQVYSITNRYYPPSND